MVVYFLFFLGGIDESSQKKKIGRTRERKRKGEVTVKG